MSQSPSTEPALAAMKQTLQDALDQINSTKCSSETRTQALKSIEHCLASALGDEQAVECFWALQYTFECNVPSRLLSWLAFAATQLDTLTRGPIDDTHDRELDTFASQIVLSLSLLQGISLSHSNTKAYLGRKYPQEVLLDLLLASRHLPSTTDADPNDCRRQGPPEPPLTSLVLDTLLCVLVDSSSSLRVFEDVGGPQAVVRILKRAGTPREVRMKCLEFLYFYLLDETTSALENTEVAEPTPPPTVPATPIRTSKPFIVSTPLKPASTYGSSTYSFSDSSSSGRSSRSASGSSTLSLSSTSSNASSSTAASSVSSSPEKSPVLTTSMLRPKSPEKGSIYRPSKPAQSLNQAPSSPPLDPVRSQYRFPKPQQKAMMMLKKEVDYIPQSPKKAQVAAILGKSPGHHPKSKSMSIVGSVAKEKDGRMLVKSRLQSAETVPDLSSYSYEVSVESPSKQPLPKPSSADKNRRTTEEKKQLLGTMLGNVDALVEGVRKAGIWGLG